MTKAKSTLLFASSMNVAEKVELESRDSDAAIEKQCRQRTY